MLVKNFLAIAATALTVQAAPLEKRAVVPHDSIRPFPEMVPNTATGNTFRRFEPYLHIAHGCQSYPAVAANGDTSGGLQDTGDSTGGCRDTGRGQTYVRGAWHNGLYGIMYAWYMPKDMPNSGVSAGAHRHEWENVVVWVNNPAVANPTLVGAAASGHGGYKKTLWPQVRGDRVQVEYFTNFPYNHELQFKSSPGRDLALVAWDSLPEAARRGLDSANFGAAIVPFKNAYGTFQNNLAKAALG